MAKGSSAATAMWSARRGEADIGKIPAAVDHRLRGEPRSAVLRGDDVHAGVGRLPGRGAEHQPQRHAGQRLVVDVGELELDVERHGAGRRSARK
jgi:hypothetical protein